MRAVREGGQILDRVSQQRARRHQADEQRRSLARQLARHDDAHAEELGTGVDTRRPAGRGNELEPGQNRRGTARREDPQEWLDELRGPHLLLLARLAHAILPEGEVLAETGTHLLGVGRMAIYLDETQNSGDPSQQPEARALGFTRGIWLVPQIGMLGFRGDLVVGDRRSGGAESLLANLLGQLVETVTHASQSDTNKCGCTRDK